MSNLITSTPNVTNFIAAYEFVALKSARVSFTNTGIANFSNSTANSMYPATQAAMFYDPYNNVAGLGGYPALTLSSCPGPFLLRPRPHCQIHVCPRYLQEPRHAVLAANCH